MRTCLYAFLAALLMAGCRSLPDEPVAAEPARPNVLIILADDLGYSDIGSYGGEIQTPNLDRLASRGLRFTSFYNNARCCPTRASLLTGLYPHQAGIGQMTTDRGIPGYRGALTENTVTIAEVLRTAGYRTGMVGKWHVSNTLERKDAGEQLAWLAHRASFGDFSPLAQYPTNRGFDAFYGNIWGVVDYFDPYSLVNGTTPVGTVPKDFYYTDAISDSASAYIDRFSSQKAPFFLYVAYTAPHWPLQALEKDIARYKDTYRHGWQPIREARYARMIAQGLFSPDDAPLSPRFAPEMDWSENPDSVWGARAMAVHAAMIDRMDQGIGRILATLEARGELDNTLILFLSDNGASSEQPTDFGPGFDRAGQTRDGRTVVFPKKKEVLPGPQTTHAGIAERWANVANVPFRFWKGRVHEGGTATPFIVHWPKGLKTAPGAISNEPGHVVDLMATLVDVAGATYPRTFQGNDITPMEGRSLMPVLAGGHRTPHDALYWEHFGARAIRKGDWKLVSVGHDAPWELYDLSKDRTELNNLAASMPERVAAMDRDWTAWAYRTHVLPAPR